MDHVIWIDGTKLSSWILNRFWAMMCFRVTLSRKGQLIMVWTFSTYWIVSKGIYGEQCILWDNKINLSFFQSLKFLKRKEMVEIQRWYIPIKLKNK